MSNGDLFSEMSADMTVKDLLNFPSGLYTSGDLVIMRQEGVWDMFRHKLKIN